MALFLNISFSFSSSCLNFSINSLIFGSDDDSASARFGGESTYGVPMAIVVMMAVRRVTNIIESVTRHYTISNVYQITTKIN